MTGICTDYARKADQHLPRTRHGRFDPARLRMVSRASSLFPVGRGLLTIANSPRVRTSAQLLLPFSLSAYAKDGYKNPSLIAMFVVGGVCLIGYGFWEAYGAKFPSAPGRILKNRTVITAIIIDVIYLLAGCE